MGLRLQKSEISTRMKSGKYSGILDPINAAQNFQLRRYSPSTNLAAFVENYWIIHWDLHEHSPYTSKVLPYPSVNIAFTAKRAWITGVVTGTYDHQLSGKGIVVGVRFRPGGFHAFWPHHISELTDRTKPVTELFEEADDAFCASVLSLEKDDPERVQLLEKLLRTRSPTPDPRIAFVNEVIEVVIADKDLRTTQALSKRFQLSERRLQQLFQEYVGVGLKWIIMRYRLQEVADRATQEVVNWTAIATELHYSDQSHLINDFKKITGKSPAEYARTLR